MSATDSRGTDHLRTYLNDHLGGANAGVEMARRLEADARGEPDAQLLGPIAADVEQDVATLQELIARFGAARHPVKEAVGWAAEKVQRLGIAEPLTGSPHLTRMLQAESLSLGVEGKLGLWQALQEVATVHPRLADVDLAGLVERARDQRRRIEAVRVAAARRAFSQVD